MWLRAIVFTSNRLLPQNIQINRQLCGPLANGILVGGGFAHMPEINDRHAASALAFPLDRD